ncbi:uncharacterized protein LOC119325476 isoform X2 [Triticum dicoccoides]|uniref:uncharacterized protein LOC119325476 isoform X2 n=1 Tax=Triticum dicoccoides TaxID=85692 RepID=UPI001891AB5F|nr:uncharacterized protein LOC119325476 isoform X2 [Triticum dicoccoides]
MTAETPSRAGAASRRPSPLRQTSTFLKAILAAELALNAARLIYDAAQVFFQKPLPAFRCEMMGLVAADWVIMLLLFAAGSSSLAVEDFVENNMRRCALLQPGTCERYKAAGVLTLLAWAFTVPVACVMLRLQRIWDEDAAATDA